jgi:hypothetical protein
MADVPKGFEGCLNISEAALQALPKNHSADEVKTLQANSQFLIAS